jgi:hypothetical protein
MEGGFSRAGKGENFKMEIGLGETLAKGLLDLRGRAKGPTFCGL